MIYDYIITKPPLDEETLMHYGVKGMRWGQRKRELRSMGLSRRQARKQIKAEKLREKYKDRLNDDRDFKFKDLRIARKIYKNDQLSNRDDKKIDRDNKVINTYGSKFRYAKNDEAADKAYEIGSAKLRYNSLKDIGFSDAKAKKAMQYMKKKGMGISLLGEMKKTSEISGYSAVEGPDQYKKKMMNSKKKK